jgi:Zn-dependent protease
MILPGLIVGFSMHEFAHAWVSHMLGDPTPKAQGRLTVNPAAHIDPIGLIMLVLFHFGWGKPVQVNPNYYKHRRLGEAAVSLAGVIMNFIIAFIGMGIIRLITMLPLGDSLMSVIIGVMTGLVQINLVLMIFNLIPIPPLDGWGVVTQIFNLERKSWYWKFYQMGPMFLMLLIVFRLTSKIISPAVTMLYYLLANIFF